METVEQLDAFQTPGASAKMQWRANAPGLHFCSAKNGGKKRKNVFQKKLFSLGHTLMVIYLIMITHKRLYPSITGQKEC